MIDNHSEVTELIEKMKEVLPIDAYPTKKLCHSMQNKNDIKMKVKNLLKIIDVLYLGDEGGIVCDISDKNSKETLIVSLTHLRIKNLHSFTKEIKAYQVNRIKVLANSNISKAF